jgi:hypothetical protein
MFAIPQSELNLFPANRFIVQSMAKHKFCSLENKDRTYNFSGSYRSCWPADGPFSAPCTSVPTFRRNVLLVSLKMEAVLSSETSQHCSTTRRRAQNKATRPVVFEGKGLRECLDMGRGEGAGKLRVGRSIICTLHQIVKCGPTHRGGEIYL